MQTERTTRVNGSMTSNMVTVSSHGPMAPDMKESTKMVKRKARDGSRSLMVATTKAHLSTTRSADLETITGLMENHTLATGVRTRWMERASSNGKTERCTPVSSSMISVKEMAHLYGPMDANTSANGKPESSTVSVPTLVKMEWRSRESGRMAARSNGSEAMQMMAKSKNRTINTERSVLLRQNSLRTFSG